MKKIILPVISAITLFLLLTACGGERVVMKDIFPTVESVNQKLSALGNITDEDSAKEAMNIYEDYLFLTPSEKAQISHINKIKDNISEISTALGKDSSPVKVMGFNVRCAEIDEGRISRVVHTIKEEAPDVLGIQEGVTEMCKELKSALSDEYEMLGNGRDDDKKGENCNVFYKKASFTLMESDTLWITDTPFVYSAHKESACARIFTYQLLKRNSDGQLFLHINTHFDHMGASARVYQAQTLTDWIIDNFDDGIPVAITGDFNCSEGSPAYKVFIGEGYEASTSYGESKRTYNGYRDGDGGGVIDFCFVNEWSKILSYKVCNEKIEGQWISDHNAIVSEIVLVPTVK